MRRSLEGDAYLRPSVYWRKYGKQILPATCFFFFVFLIPLTTETTRNLCLFQNMLYSNSDNGANLRLWALLNFRLSKEFFIHTFVLFFDRSHMEYLLNIVLPWI